MKKRVLSLILAVVMVCALTAPAAAHDMGKAGELPVINCGGSFTAAIDGNGTLWTWGERYNGGRRVYIPEKELDDVAAVSCGAGRIAAIKTDSTLWMWGQNSSGELGRGTTEWCSIVPAKILDDVAAVSSGGNHTAAIQTDGTLWTWGQNWYGQLGNGGEGNRKTHDEFGNFMYSEQTVPVQVLDDVAAVSCGGARTAAIKTDGTLWMWGSNEYGQLGNGGGGNAKNYFTSIIQTVPVKVMDSVAAVSCGGKHTAAIKTDGTLWMWGDNEFGELGNGSTDSSNVPVKVMDDVAAVSCGGIHTAAIKTDGTLWIWGNNSSCQLGNGGGGKAGDIQTAPVKVMDDVAAVSCGGSHTAAVKTDGTRWIWGNNTYFQLGLAGGDTTKDFNTPLQVTLDIPPKATANLNGGSGSTALELNGDGTLKKPADPTREGYIFAGWYTDSSFTTQWDFSRKVTGDMSLYARWLPAAKIILQLDGQTTAIDTAKDAPMNVPTNPTREGYNFAGWYIDAALTIPWNFNTAVTGDMSLYARWTPISSTATETGRSQANITFNGAPVALEAYALTADSNGGDVTFVRLRDVAAVLDNSEAQFNVEWKNGAIYVTTNAPYTTKNGAELQPIVVNTTGYKWNTNPILFDGETKPLEGIVITDVDGGGHTFFKLRDLAAAIGFTVDWSAEKGIYIETK